MWTKRSYDAVFSWSAGGRQRQAAEKIMLADGLTDEVDRLRSAKNLGDWFKITQEAAAAVGMHTLERSAMEAEAELSQIAAALGRKGGKSKSAAKSEAARANGRKGGRPRKG
jgi:hypothetical protein